MDDSRDGIKAAVTFAAFIVSPALFGVGVLTGFFIWGMNW